MDFELKDKVAIVGVGCTKFGEHFDMSYQDLIVDAAYEAFQDAGIGLEDIEAAWLSTAFPDAGVYKGRWGGDLFEALPLHGIPITRVANYCGSAGDALQNAAMALLTGRYKVVLAVGVEKLRDRPPRGSLVHLTINCNHPFYQKGFTAAGTMAISALRHFHEYGLTRQHLAKISVKNHRNGVLNPKALYRREVDIDTVLNSPMVAYPLTVLDSCPNTDGAAAAVLVRKEDAKAFNKDHVLIKGLGFSCCAAWDLPFYDITYDWLHVKSMTASAQMAYKQAGIKNPLKEIDIAELHDAFSFDEIVEYESMGFCDKGQGGRFVDEGVFERDGELPVNVGGGLLCCGHPVGATGLRMVYELTKQLQGKAGAMQLKEVKIGFAQNTGGAAGGVTAVTILGCQ